MKISKLFAITLQSKSGLIFFFALAAYNLLLGVYLKDFFCSFADVGDIVFAISTADIIFRPENTVNTYAFSCTHCSVFRHGNEYC